MKGPFATATSPATFQPTMWPSQGYTIYAWIGASDNYNEGKRHALVALWHPSNTKRSKKVDKGSRKVKNCMVMDIVLYLSCQLRRIATRVGGPKPTSHIPLMGLSARQYQPQHPNHHTIHNHHSINHPTRMVSSCSPGEAGTSRAPGVVMWLVMPVCAHPPMLQLWGGTLHKGVPLRECPVRFGIPGTAAAAVLSFPRREVIKTWEAHQPDYDRQAGQPEGIPTMDGTVTYNTIDMSIWLIQWAGQRAILTKTDIKHSYKFIPIHPDDIPALDIHWIQHLLWDVTLPMASRSGCAIFETFSEALQHLSQWPGYGDMCHVLDDFLMVSKSCALADECLKTIQGLWEWLQYTMHAPFMHCFSDYFLDYNICEYIQISNICFLCFNEIRKGIFGGNYDLEILIF